ncbi:MULTISPECIES: hypothetical protein [unclassified Clostridium]|uniref:hypothetical protein n=1 Tax=unclassified Clostridium TaxID=2614128 RepID=UPI002079FB2C|nr:MULTISPECIES: hypothetical protein [unclassified Clostridium]
MQKTNIYNTFEFIGRLAMPKETEKFKVHIKTEYDSKWVREELRLNVRADENSETITIGDGYFNKQDYEFVRKGAKEKLEDGSYREVPDVQINWNDRKNKSVIDKVAFNQKYILDLSNNKERYDIKQAIDNLKDDAVDDKIIKEIKEKYSILESIEANKDMIIALEKELKKLEDLKTEYINKVDMIEDLLKLMKTTEGTNTIFKITGNIDYSEWNEKVYRTLEVKRIEKATAKEAKKLKLSGELDIYFNSCSLDEGMFETNKKYFLNCWTKTWDSQLKKQIYVPINLIADGSRLDLENPKHIKLIETIANAFRYHAEGKEDKDEDKIYQIAFEIKFANGSEKKEITIDDLTETQREYVESGVITLEDVILEMGGNKYGERVREVRLVKPTHIKDFMNGAEETDLTLEDFVIDRDIKKAEEKAKDITTDIENEEEEDLL